MKVCEAIELLSKQDQDLDLLIYHEGICYDLRMSIESCFVEDGDIVDVSTIVLDNSVILKTIT